MPLPFVCRRDSRRDRRSTAAAAAAVSRPAAAVHARASQIAAVVEVKTWNQVIAVAANIHQDAKVRTFKKKMTQAPSDKQNIHLLVI